MNQPNLFQQYDIDSRFAAFHEKNPRVLELFVRFAEQARNSGRRRIGAKAIAERVRWETQVETQGDSFKINNSLVSRYARLVAKKRPDLAPMFSMRSLKIMKSKYFWSRLGRFDASTRGPSMRPFANRRRVSVMPQQESRESMGGVASARSLQGASRPILTLWGQGTEGLGIQGTPDGRRPPALGQKTQTVLNDGKRFGPDGLTADLRRG